MFLIIKSIKKLGLTCYAIQFTGTNLIRIIHTMKVRESTGIQCTFMMCEHNAWQNHNLKIANKSSERVAKFKYLVTILTNFHAQRHYEQIKLREGLLPMGTEFCLSVWYITT